ncbi:uncharacterized protein K460DRAFT_131996 [Cucurbitaria berberidis CBS 394.84]|uniref:Uncharacterized protein n=1 Tax=Cucurbitaria berberidis CBS 394.84 TaxID=1168544 RepID=A0A9P4GJR0_9PLEO|nr:uncharacterized protein K460DRAFT_131996 [Cucurbitaria berberidis CBS 394.84]KAF1846840.1 hypothetical protein K460DRAFT_131996 [Cucurbitaria berberidis CBS 394.84]
MHPPNPSSTIRPPKRNAKTLSPTTQALSERMKTRQHQHRPTGEHKRYLRRHVRRADSPHGLHNAWQNSVGAVFSDHRCGDNWPVVPDVSSCPAHFPLR